MAHSRNDPNRRPLILNSVMKKNQRHYFDISLSLDSKSGARFYEVYPSLVKNVELIINIFERLRTEVRGYFNIHGTRFQAAAFHLKSKFYNVVFSNNQPFQYLANQRQGRLTTSYFFLFLMENSILKYLVPWMLKSPLTSILKNTI